MMEKYITDERTGLKYELIGAITWLSEMMSRRKNRSQSGYGVRGISVISRSIIVYSMAIC